MTLKPQGEQFMRDFFRTAPAATLVGGILLTITGCDNAQSRQDAAARATIDQAIADLNDAVSMATMSGEDAALDEAERSLKGVVSSLSGLTDVDGGQASARHLLSAQALRELAIIRMERALALEREQMLARGRMHRQLDMIVRLDATADGLERIQFDASRNELSQVRTSAEQMRDALSQQLATLDGPIADLRDANIEDAERVAQLEALANQKRREASDLGRVRGFGQFLEALDFEREADSLDLRVAGRQAELTYQYEPAAAFTMRSIKNAQDLLDRISQSSSRLAAYTAEAADQARDLRDEIARIRDEFNATLRDVNNSTTDELQQVYDEAADFLDRAASQASQAVRSSADANAARLEQARALELAGRVHSRHVQGLEQQLELLNRTRTVGSTVNGLNTVDRVRDTIAESIDQGKAAADDAFSQARDLLEQMNRGDSAQIEHFKMRVDNARNALMGGTMTMTNGSAAPSEGGMRSTGGATRGDWLNGSAERFLDAMQAMSTDPGRLVEMSQRITSTNRNETRLMEANIRLLGNLEDLKAELRSELGGTGSMLPQIEAGMAAAMRAGAYVDYELSDMTADGGIVTMITASGDRNTMDLVRESDGWMLVSDGAMLGENASQDVFEETLTGVRRLSDIIAAHLEQLRDGAFASTAEFDQRFGAAMQQLMNG